MKWKLISQKEIYETNWIRITADEVETESGYRLTWSVVRKGPAVLVIPWDGKFTYIVGMYRYPVEAYSWEFVAGYADHGTLIEDSARIELEEEAGIKAENFIKIGEFFTAPGFCDQRFHMFLATGLTHGARKPEKDEEAMKIKKVSLADIDLLIEKGKIMDGPTITAFSFLKTYLKRSSHTSKKVVE